VKPTTLRSSRPPSENAHRRSGAPCTGSRLRSHSRRRSATSRCPIIGTGVQARSHARAVRRIRNITEIIVVGRTAEKVEAFAAETGAKVASTYAEAIAAADIVCCCTHATEPVARREWLRPGVHVNSVGFAAGSELDPLVFANALVVVESRAAAVGEFPNGAVDITTAVNQKLVEMTDIREVGELVLGLRSGRTHDNQITVYRSVGVAAQDAVAAGLVLQAARGRGLGAEVWL
jgi:alanine dehydrogenase